MVLNETVQSGHLICGKSIVELHHPTQLNLALMQMVTYKVLTFFRKLICGMALSCFRFIFKRLSSLKGLEKGRSV